MRVTIGCLSRTVILAYFSSSLRKYFLQCVVVCPQLFEPQLLDKLLCETSKVDCCHYHFMNVLDMW